LPSPADELEPEICIVPMLLDTCPLSDRPVICATRRPLLPCGSVYEKRTSPVEASYWPLFNSTSRPMIAIEPVSVPSSPKRRSSMPGISRGIWSLARATLHSPDTVSSCSDDSLGCSSLASPSPSTTCGASLATDSSDGSNSNVNVSPSGSAARPVIVPAESTPLNRTYPSTSKGRPSITNEIWSCCTMTFFALIFPGFFFSLFPVAFLSSSAAS